MFKPAALLVAARTQANQQAVAALGLAFRSAERNEEARRASMDAGERRSRDRESPVYAGPSG